MSQETDGLSHLNFLEHGAVEILRKPLLSGPGSSSGEMRILISLLIVQSHSMRSVGA